MCAVEMTGGHEHCVARTPHTLPLFTFVWVVRSGKVTAVPPDAAGAVVASADIVQVHFEVEVNGSVAPPGAQLPPGVVVCVEVSGSRLPTCTSSPTTTPLLVQLTWAAEAAGLVRLYQPADTAGSTGANATWYDGWSTLPVQVVALVRSPPADDWRVVATSQVAALTVPNSRRRLQPYACGSVFVRPAVTCTWCELPALTMNCCATGVLPEPLAATHVCQRRCRACGAAGTRRVASGGHGVPKRRCTAAAGVQPSCCSWRRCCCSHLGAQRFNGHPPRRGDDGACAVPLLPFMRACPSFTHIGGEQAVTDATASATCLYAHHLPAWGILRAGGMPGYSAVPRSTTRGAAAFAMQEAASCLRHVCQTACHGTATCAFCSTAAASDADIVAAALVRASDLPGSHPCAASMLWVTDTCTATAVGSGTCEPPVAAAVAGYRRAPSASLPPPSFLLHQHSHFSGNRFRTSTGATATAAAVTTIVTATAWDVPPDGLLPVTKVLCRGAAAPAHPSMPQRCARRQSCVLRDVYYLDGEWYMVRDDWNVQGHLQWDGAAGHRMGPNYASPSGAAPLHAFTRPALADTGVMGGVPFSLRQVDASALRFKISAGGARPATVSRVRRPHLLLSRSSPDVFGHVIVDELLPAVWMALDHDVAHRRPAVVLMDALGAAGPASMSARVLSVLSGDGALFRNGDRLCATAACVFDTVVVGAGCRSFLFPRPPERAAVRRLATVLLASRALLRAHLSPEASFHANAAAAPVVIVDRRLDRKLLAAAKDVAARLPVPTAVVFLEDLSLAQQWATLHSARVVVAVDGSAMELAALTMRGETCNAGATSALVAVVPDKGYSHLHFHGVLQAALPCRHTLVVEAPACVASATRAAEPLVIADDHTLFSASDGGGRGELSQPPPPPALSATAAARCATLLAAAVQRGLRSVGA